MSPAGIDHEDGPGYTPGPWAFARSGGKSSRAFVFGTATDRVGRTDAENPRGEADARLCAAAPALVEALRKVQDYYNGEASIGNPMLPEEAAVLDAVAYALREAGAA